MTARATHELPKVARGAVDADSPSEAAREALSRQLNTEQPRDSFCATPPRSRPRSGNGGQELSPLAPTTPPNVSRRIPFGLPPDMASGMNNIDCISLESMQQAADRKAEVGLPFVACSVASNLGQDAHTWFFAETLYEWFKVNPTNPLTRQRPTTIHFYARVNPQSAAPRYIGSSDVPTSDEPPRISSSHPFLSCSLVDGSIDKVDQDRATAKRRTIELMYVAAFANSNQVMLEPWASLLAPGPWVQKVWRHLRQRVSADLYVESARALVTRTILGDEPDVLVSLLCLCGRQFGIVNAALTLAQRRGHPGLVSRIATLLIGNSNAQAAHPAIPRLLVHSPEENALIREHNEAESSPHLHHGAPTTPKPRASKRRRFTKR